MIALPCPSDHKGAIFGKCQNDSILRPNDLLILVKCNILHYLTHSNRFYEFFWLNTKMGGARRTEKSFFAGLSLCALISAPIMSLDNDILDFKIGPREIESRLLRIGQITADEFVLERYHDYDLSEEADVAFSHYFEALEAKEYDAALLISEKLFKLPFMSRFSKGFVALAVVELDAFDRPIASVAREATPFARVDDNDWAFYLALAKLKRRCNHPLMAASLLDLAEAVPFHHPALIDRERKLIIRCRIQSTQVNPDHF